MANAGTFRCGAEMAGRHVVTLRASGQMQHHVHAVKRLGEPATRDRVSFNMLHARLIRARVACEDPQMAAGLSQHGHHTTSDGAGAAGDEQRRIHG
jgi:hypothetical protein